MDVYDLSMKNLDTEVFPSLTLDNYWDNHQNNGGFHGNMIWFLYCSIGLGGIFHGIIKGYQWRTTIRNQRLVAQKSSSKVEL